MRTSGELKHEFYEWLDKNPDKRAWDWVHLKLKEANKDSTPMDTKVKISFAETAKGLEEAKKLSICWKTK